MMTEDHTPFEWIDTPDRPRATIEAIITDDAMAPEFLAGWSVTADLTMEPRNGDPVLLMFRWHRSFIARLVIDCAGTRWLENYANPPTRIPLPADACQVLLVVARRTFSR